MKKTIFAMLAMLTLTVSASAFNLTVGTSENGKVAFMVDNSLATTADEGQTVTVSITPDGGYATKEVTAEVYSDWGSARAPGIDIVTSLELNKVDENTYTFKMPRADVRVNVIYGINIHVDTDDPEKETPTVEGVKVEMNVVEGEVPTYDATTGLTTIPVVIESIEIPAQADATAENPKKVTVDVAATIRIGNNVFVVKEIKAGAFKSTEPTAVVEKVVLPDTKEPLTIEAGAMKPDGTPLTVVTPLALLDDYALMATMKENFEAGKVSAIAVAPNRYWTFSSGVDVIVPEGITVYRAFTDNGVIRILPIDEANQSKVIKANNGVLLACTNGQGGNAYEIVANAGGQPSGSSPATFDADSYPDNALVPVIKEKNYDAGQYYILKDNQFHSIAASGKVPACKAVYSVAKANR